MTFRVLILADSRGYSLGTQLHNMNLYSCNIDLHIMPYSGGKVSDIVRKGLRDCNQFTYDRVYLMGGVNNLSSLRGGIAVPNYHKWDILVSEIMYKCNVTIHLTIYLSTTPSDIYIPVSPPPPHLLNY